MLIISPYEYWKQLQFNFVRFILWLIIISSKFSCQHRSPWLSLATRLYRLLLPGGLQGYILLRHRAAAYRFPLVVLLLLVHVIGSTGVHRLWVRAYLSSSVPHVDGKQHGGRKGRQTQLWVNAMLHQVLGVRIPRDDGQGQIVRSGNYCCSSIRAASIDENKNTAIDRLLWLTLKPLVQNTLSDQ